METIEVLQSGGTSEGEGRLLALTAQLAAARCGGPHPSHSLKHCPPHSSTTHFSYFSLGLRGTGEQGTSPRAVALLSVLPTLSHFSQDFFTADFSVFISRPLSLPQGNPTA